MKVFILMLLMIYEIPTGIRIPHREYITHQIPDPSIIGNLASTSIGK